MKNIKGFFGGSDGGSAQHTPTEDADNLRSSSTAKLLYAVCEGSIKGLVNGFKSVFLNDVPIQGPDNVDGTHTWNFANIDPPVLRLGTPAQDYIPGFPSSETEVGGTGGGAPVEVKFGIPVSISIVDSTKDAVRVTIGIPSLTKNIDGSLRGNTVQLKFYVNCNGGGLVLYKTKTITGKTTSRYQFSVNIPLRALGPSPWIVQVERVSVDDPNLQSTSKTFIDSHTLIVDTKLTFANTAVLAVKADSKLFSSIPTVSLDIFGLEVSLPNNYTPESYDPTTGVWTPAVYSGEFVDLTNFGWTRNPAWILYDLLVNDRYGLGDYIKDWMVDKWALYQVARYCDELVPDGYSGTGMEPRFTCSCYIQTQSDAYQLIQAMASVYRGMTYWSAGSVSTAQDRPSDPVYLFTNSNVVDGRFTYSSTARQARHNAALVAWNDPADGYRQKFEYVADDQGIVDLGFVNQASITAFGSTSRGQANRLGRWTVYTDLNELDVVVFSPGFEGMVVTPGNTVLVHDQDRLQVRLGGRLLAYDAATSTATLDSSPSAVVGDTLYVIDAAGNVESQPILGITGAEIVTAAFAVPPEPMAQWIIATASIEPKLVRVLAVKETKPDQYELTCVESNPSKYDYIDLGRPLTDPNDGIGGSGTGSGNPGSSNIQPKNTAISEHLYISGVDVKVAMDITADMVTEATAYKMEWRKENGNWSSPAEAPTPFFEVQDIIPGRYAARVYAKVRNLWSQPGTAVANILGKTAPPANVTNFKAEVNGTTVDLSWDPVADLDLNYYHVKQGGTDWGTATTIQGMDKLSVTRTTWANPISTSVSLFWIKAVDTSGNESVTAAQATVASNLLDDYIDPSEKRDIKADRDLIQTEKPGLDAQALAAGVSSTAYDSAVTSLEAYLDTLTGTGGWNPATHDWRDYTTTYHLSAGGGIILRGKFYDVWAAAEALKQAIATAGLAITETVNTKLRWDFGPTDPLGFTATGFSTSSSPTPDDQNARRWAGLGAGSISTFSSHNGLALNLLGREGYLIQVRLRRNSGGWVGKARWSVSGVYSSYKTIPAPAIGQWVTVIWDLRTPTSGPSIQTQSPVTSYTLELGETSGNIDVDYVVVGVYGAGSRIEYDLSLQSSITDLLAMLDTTVLGNTVITTSSNMIPNPKSELTVLPTSAIGLVGLLNPASGNQYSGNGCRKFNASIDSTMLITPKYDVTPGDAYYVSGYLKNGGSGVAYVDVIFSTGATESISNATSSYVQGAKEVVVPAGATWMQLGLRATVIGYFDELVLRKKADAWLLANGGIEAYFARIIGIQTFSLGVGPLLLFKSSSTNPVLLQTRPDGSMSRVTATDRTNNPNLGSENINDSAVYMDDTRSYPNSDVVTYETRWGGTTENRGVVINMGSAFATSGQTGLLVKWTGGGSPAISVYGVVGIGNYTLSPLIAASAPAPATHDDKLTVIYYPTMQKDTHGVANIRLRILINGQSILVASDTELGAGVYGGTQGGYAGLYLAGNVRVSDPRFGRGYVTLQDGVAKADIFMTSNYAEDGSGNPTDGAKVSFSVSGSQLPVIKCGPNGIQVGTAILNQASLRRSRIMNGYFAGAGTVDKYGWLVTPGSGLTVQAVADGPSGGAQNFSHGIYHQPSIGTTIHQSCLFEQAIQLPPRTPLSVYEPKLKYRYKFYLPAGMTDNGAGDSNVIVTIRSLPSNAVIYSSTHSPSGWPATWQTVNASLWATLSDSPQDAILQISTGANVTNDSNSDGTSAGLIQVRVAEFELVM